MLIHGAGDVGWYSHLVERELKGRGHDVVVMDLPVDDAASLSDYADSVVQAIGDRRAIWLSLRSRSAAMWHRSSALGFRLG